MLLRSSRRWDQERKGLRLQDGFRESKLATERGGKTEGSQEGQPEPPPQTQCHPGVPDAPTTLNRWAQLAQRSALLPSASVSSPGAHLPGQKVDRDTRPRAEGVSGRPPISPSTPVVLTCPAPVGRPACLGLSPTPLSPALHYEDVGLVPILP